MNTPISRSKVNQILNITNILIFALGGLFFFSSITSSPEARIFDELKAMFYTGSPTSSLNWMYVTWAYAFLQSLFLTIRFVPTIWEIFDSYNSEYYKEKFWSHDSIILFVIGMWILLMIFFSIGLFPFLKMLFDKSANPSVQINSDIMIFGIQNALINLLIQALGVFSFYSIFWTGKNFYPKKYFLIPLIMFGLYMIYMLPVFF